MGNPGFRAFKFFVLCVAAGSALTPSKVAAQILTGYDTPAQAQAQAQPSEPEPIVETPPAPLSQPVVETLLETYVTPPAPMPEPVVADNYYNGPLTSPVFTTDRGSRERGLLEAPKVVPLAEPVSQQEAVDLQADNLIHDDKTQTITASGDVFLTQAGRILRADEIVYDLQADKVIARGHVVLNERNGDIHYSEEVEFNDHLKNGFVKGLKSYLMDGSRFTAEEGKRKNGNRTIMEHAAYTPCEPCKAEPDNAPAWQIVAAEVQHNEEEARVSYKHARFEVHGVPVAYVPYFSHPDGTVKRKSGFLTPSVGYKSDLGAFAAQSYYWSIAPDKDLTAGLMVMTEEDPLFTGEWRQRWDSASLEMQGGITNSKRTDSSAGINTREDEDVRGHVLGEGRWDINDKWRSGMNIAWASDDQYMRQYDFTNEDVLKNELYAERFSGRDYAVGRVLSFQDIRIREFAQDQPDVLPEVVVSVLGEPGAMPLLKGRWSVDASMLGLQRPGSDQDMNRMSLNAGWERRLVSDYGLLTRVETNMRGDLYSARDRTIATPGSGRSNESTAARFYPSIHVQSSYPLVKPMETMQATIEPIIALTAAPNINVSGDIPNEDSQDVQIDASNIFEPNRFPGHDRIEGQSRITYGIRTGLYSYGGAQGDIFLGQSHRFSDDDNPFPEGSGLDEQESDIVGQISARSAERYSFDYRFQLASENIASQRHEVDLFANWDRFSLGSRYMFAKELEGTEIDDSREQIRAWTGYELTDSWGVRAGATQDLGDEPGLRQAHLGLDYHGQCYSWAITGEKNLTDDATGESETAIIFRIGLKNLGEFEAGGLQVASTNE